MRASEEVAELPGATVDGTDGIAEEDHPIPFWFNAAFVGTIVFAIFYSIYYLGSGWSAASQYEAEVAAAKAVTATQGTVAAETNPYHGNAPAIAEGQLVFVQICAACHKPDASGLVGPSLVDPYWKYGSSDHELFETVMNGRPGGMPAWGPQLGGDKIWKVLAYVETLPKSDKPGVGAPGAAPVPGTPGGS
jgi:cytochrome c oxidase cbb3-type subunit 3